MLHLGKVYCNAEGELPGLIGKAERRSENLKVSFSVS